ncbi:MULTISPECIES: hypothetical protein [Stenotrophomonas]|uniref:Secreted protein n=1 Tax=Stenotrophomonas maltophilia TaxID=40324 RepID=A0A4S2CVR1_STEMA|nr:MULTISPECIES: hypothetical protein [Stenotrophomonas]TGY32542.1 hypothetical protein E5352_15270 [Stenotrophomonas maltophilia]
MRITVMASIRMRWWLRCYLAAVVWCARATGVGPNWDRVETWIRRGLVLQTTKVSDGRSTD